MKKLLSVLFTLVLLFLLVKLSDGRGKEIIAYVKYLPHVKNKRWQIEECFRILVN